MSSSQVDGKQPSELQQNLEIIQQIALFEGLPASVLKLLAYLAVRADYQQGDVLVEKGDDLGMAIYIVSGKLDLYRQKDNLQDYKPLREYDEGQFLGGFSLLGALPSLFTIKAQTKCCLLLLQRKVFSKVLAQYPELHIILQQTILQQLHRWEEYTIDELESCCLQRVGVTLL